MLSIQEFLASNFFLTIKCWLKQATILLCSIVAWPPAVRHAPCHPLSLHPRPVCACGPSAPAPATRPSQVRLSIHVSQARGQIHRWIIIYRCYILAYLINTTYLVFCRMKIFLCHYCWQSKQTILHASLTPESVKKCVSKTSQNLWNECVNWKTIMIQRLLNVT